MSLALRGRKRRLVVPRGSLADGEAPFAALAHLDGGRHGWRHATAMFLALAFHAAFGFAAAVQHVTARHPPSLAPHPEIQASLQREPAPKPVPPPPPRARASQPQPHYARAPREPPAPAQAARVVAQSPEASGPADLTGFDLVVGEGKSYAGGYTAAKGTSTRAVETPNAVVGGAPNAAPLPDLSRPATVLRRDWGCAWPEEAQDSDLRDARVTIRVSVGSDGAPSRVEIMSAPTGGFGEAARRCAEREIYRPALDRNGKPIAAETNLFNVHFLR